MRFALGELKWPPSEFWQSTPHEFKAAYYGSRGEFGQTERKEASFIKFRDEIVKAENERKWQRKSKN